MVDKTTKELCPNKPFKRKIDEIVIGLWILGGG
jgi:hypothetical protein